MFWRKFLQLYYPIVCHKSPAGGFLWVIAIFKISSIDQSTILLEYKSITVARYNYPSSVGIYVISPTHFSFGLLAQKSLFNRFGAIGKLWLESVVFLYLFFIFTFKFKSFMMLDICFLDIIKPYSSNSLSCILLVSYLLLPWTNIACISSFSWLSTLLTNTTSLHPIIICRPIYFNNFTH